MTQSLLSVTNLSAEIDRRQILSGVSLKISAGKLHVLMGPNGSGKSTLAKALAGDPAVHVTGGTVRFAGKNLLVQAPDVRARAGLFLSFQYPVGISGLSLSDFLTAALRERQLNEVELSAILDEPDSGLDVDALRALAKTVDGFHRQGMAILLITHYHRVLRYLRPDAVHVMVGGHIVQSGGAELAEMVERNGYASFALSK